MAAKVGTVVSGNKGAYRYLASSIKNFHSPRQIAQLLYTNGFSTIEYYQLLLGAAGVFVAA